MTVAKESVYCNDVSADWKPGADSDDEKPKVKKQQLRKREAEIEDLQQENKRLKHDLAIGLP